MVYHYEFQGGGTLHAQLEVWKAACSDTTPCFDTQPTPSTATTTSTTTTAQTNIPCRPVEECPSAEASDGNYSFVFPILTTLIIWMLCYKIRSNIEDIKNSYQKECFFYCWFFLIVNITLDVELDDLCDDKQRNAHVKKFLKHST